MLDSRFLKSNIYPIRKNSNGNFLNFCKVNSLKYVEVSVRLAKSHFPKRCGLMIKKK